MGKMFFIHGRNTTIFFFRLISCCTTYSLVYLFGKYHYPPDILQLVPGHNIPLQNEKVTIKKTCKKKINMKNMTVVNCRYNTIESVLL